MKNYKKIKLYPNLYLIVDKTIENKYLLQGWTYSSYGYVRTSKIQAKENGLSSNLLHRALLNCPKEMCVDHINSNKLDNRIANLRIVPKAINNRNRKLGKNNTTGFKGVQFDGKKQTWSAFCQIDKYTYFKKNLKTREEAALAYNKLSADYHGEFGKLNTIYYMETATLTNLASAIGTRQTWKKIVDKYPDYFIPIHKINDKIVVYKLNLPCGIVTFFIEEKTRNLKNRPNLGRKKKYT